MEAGDLIICRHLMFHLPARDNIEIIRKLSTSSASFLILTTYLRADENSKDFVLAMGHHVNLFRSPYCIVDPAKLILDNSEDLYLGMWELDAHRKTGILRDKNSDLCM